MQRPCLAEQYTRQCNPRFYEERLLPLMSSFLLWMVEGAKLFHAVQWRIPVSQSVPKEGISRQRDNIELVRNFAVSSLRSREDFRLPLQWLYEVFLLDHQGWCKGQPSVRHELGSVHKVASAMAEGSSVQVVARYHLTPDRPQEQQAAAEPYSNRLQRARTRVGSEGLGTAGETKLWSAHTQTSTLAKSKIRTLNVART